MQLRRGRSGIIVGLLSLSVLAGAALTASPAQAASGTGPYYADPAWDQKVPTATRFVVLTDWNSAAVLDKETGLVWERSPVTTNFLWSEARIECTARTTGNRKGWRLPSVQELVSLVHPAQQNPALPPGHPFLTVLPDGYWSATTVAVSPSNAWDVHFFFGSVGNDSKSESIHVWCVRGGMNADVY